MLSEPVTKIMSAEGIAMKKLQITTTTAFAFT
jgi:hypothetical protein